MSNSQKIQNLIASIDKISVENASVSPDGSPLGPPVTSTTGEGMNSIDSSSQQLHLTKVFEKLIAFNPNSDCLYPGSLIQGKSLPDGVLNPIGVQARTPITLTVTDLVLSDPTAKYSVVVNKPALDSVTNAISSIIHARLQTQQPAQISYLKTEMHSIQEAFLKLDGSYSWLSNSVNASFSETTKSYKTKIVLRFIQKYYTVSCNPPSSPISFFDRVVKYDDLTTYINAGNPPVYISSVVYGRELWMEIQTDYEEDEMLKTLSATFSGLGGKGDLNITDSQKEVIDNSSIQIYGIGGSGIAALKVLAVTSQNLDAVNEYFIQGANYSAESPGVIISYTVRYLRDNSVARVSSSTDYNIVTSSSPNPILQKLLSGQTVYAIFDGKDCPAEIGTIGRNLTYSVIYKHDQSWTVTGPNINGDEQTAIYFNGDIDMSIISIWGGRFFVDKTGKFFNVGTTNEIGHLK